MNTSFKANRPRGIYILPNLFTVGSFFGGFFAIISSYNGHYENAALAIFIAMIMDTLDGRVARLTNTMTSFGAMLDSLADVVSFAVAPALLAYTWGLSAFGKFGWSVSFIYMVAVALRLARFNTQIGNADKRYFQGIPCPAAAAVVTSFVWICSDLETTGKVVEIILVCITIMVSVLMVSNIRFRSFKDAELKNNVSFVVILAMVMIFVLITFDPSKVLFIIFFGYAISGPAMTVWGLHQKKRQRKHFSIHHKKHEKS